MKKRKWSKKLERKLSAEDDICRSMAAEIKKEIDAKILKEIHKQAVIRPLLNKNNPGVPEDF